MRRDDWLAERLADSPEPLRARLAKEIDAIPEGADPVEGFMEAACRLLDGVRGGIDQRAAAFDLLAADGLLTLACEAAAVYSPDAIVERCRRMGPGGRLGELAAEWASER